MAHLQTARGSLSPSFSKPPARPSSTPRGSSQFLVGADIAFCIFAAANLLAALYAPIQDCDEVYNYWEPVHYLRFGHGLQTWEYSPEFSLRSWVYVALHAAAGKLCSLGLFASSKTAEFYSIRVVLSLICAACEARLFAVINKVFNPRVAIMFMVAMLSSPGMYIASPALLPASFSMYANMLGMAAFLDWQGGAKTHTGIMCFGIGGLIGWPYAAALVLPFLLEESLFASITKDVSEFLRRFVLGSLSCMTVLMFQAGIDTFFYRKPVVTPWNMVIYNILSGSERGPDVFGTEPPDFYLRNLLINFNFWFPLALLAAPVLLIEYLTREKSSKFIIVRSIFFTLPIYAWLLIFSFQAHKEERFMYPAYPFIGLNAALSFHSLLGWLGQANPASVFGKIPPRIKLAVVSAFVLLAVEIGLARTIGTITAYRAPLQVYAGLTPLSESSAEVNVCLGKEWYRFPSSYFLPTGYRVKFIKSEFNGLLPGEFQEARHGFGLFSGTWLMPSGMNDQNLSDPGKYIDISRCQYLVDSSFPSSSATELEPDYTADTGRWEEVQCSSFLDAASTRLLGRLLWLPPLDVLGDHQRKWGKYCLLKRRG